MNVLVLAYSCGPDRGSEPGVGWNWVGEIGSRHQTWVITTKEFKVEIEDKIRRESKNNLRFYFLDFPLRKIFWLFGGAGIRTHYMLWQVGALFKAVNLHRKTRFDLAHHLTFGINYLPTFLFLLPVPLIWGPLGGGEMIEPVLMRNFSWSGKLRERGKKVIQGVYPYIPINYIAMYKSALLLVRTVDTLKTIPYCFHDKTRVIPESGIAAMEIKGRKKVLSDAEGKRIISVGRLIEIKAFSIAIEAFGMMAGKYPHAQLIIIGEGRERKRLERAAISLGLSNRVFFTGKIQRARSIENIRIRGHFTTPKFEGRCGMGHLGSFFFWPACHLPK